MAIRLYVMGFLLVQSLYFSQNIDSLNKVYKQYYETVLLKTSPSGEYAVLNHHNTYGKDEDELFDITTRRGKIIDKHNTYIFFGSDVLLMVNNDHCRFFYVKTGQYRDIVGNYGVVISKRHDKAILFDVSAKTLILASKDGKVLWKENSVSRYKLDERSNHLIYTSGNQLGIITLKDHRSKTIKLDNDIQWISSYGNKIYCATIKREQIELNILELPSNQLTKQFISSPENFEFVPALNTYFEVREDEHFIFPLYLKSKLNSKQNPELKITYSNKSSKDKFLNFHLGIYNIKKKQWEYQPDAQKNLPVYKFLNDKGDFILFDESSDVVENHQNAILDLELILDYGKSSYMLSQKRAGETNYLWDRSTEQFIFFGKKGWISHHVRTGKEEELLPSNPEGWVSDKHNGLGNIPEIHPIRVKNRDAILLSNQYDYYLLDLKTHQVKRITNGEEKNIKYKLLLSKDQYSESSWNAKNTEIDPEKELTFKLFDNSTYDTGFARYSIKNNKTVFYQQQKYKEMLPYEKGIFFTSDFALEPFKLTQFKNGKYTVVYESLKTEKAALQSMKYKIFQYKTAFGTSNAALLFPSGYDEQKKYPMVVNIYEKQSHDLCYFLPPYLTSTVGFNYVHYLMNGYIVLLPDLQYKTADIKNSVIKSLEKSIDSAKLLASVDEKNIGVTGLSYGGYETGLALTQSKYFKTGVAGVMVSDLISTGLSNSEFIPVPNYLRVESQQFRMKNNVFDDWDNYLENSPIYHLKNVNTPVLIWTGLKDPNVSPAQSKMFFLGLKRLKKKAVLLEYVNERHNVFNPSNQLDLNVKTWQWFDYYLKNKKPADWIIPVTK